MKKKIKEPSYKIYINYRNVGFPQEYQKVFDTQEEAMDWVKSNNIEITKIDMI